MKEAVFFVISLFALFNVYVQTKLHYKKYKERRKTIMSINLFELYKQELMIRNPEIGFNEDRIFEYENELEELLEKLHELDE